jgi:hypothetical protein
VARRHYLAARPSRTLHTRPGAPYRLIPTHRHELEAPARDRPSAATEAPITETPRAESDIRELLHHWDILKRLAPDPGRAVSFLAQESKLPHSDVDHLRRVRNQCAHSGEHGWPSDYDINKALVTARELRRRLKTHASQSAKKARSEPDER